MKYEKFDKLIGRGSANQVILLLQKEAYTIDDLAKALELDRTSVFYHLKNLVINQIIEKKMIGKTAIYGLLKKKRGLKAQEAMRDER
ncbi:winged helix-turn-helix domain-containing protein [Patescibacteria group bacterium]|nr:winged helix-turn-helix domain-containing protein [Patescibacteria group bacterium]